MPIRVKFDCDGCFKQADSTTWPKRHFDSANGKGYGFGGYRFDGFDDIKPEGWVSFDPYMGCCYCPECWAEIEGDGPWMPPPKEDE